MRKLLYPFSLLYNGITCLRNKLYDYNIYKPFQFDVLTIGVGNLSVGGTGKSPHVEYLIDLLEKRYSVATLSRGYGRKSKGFLLAQSEVDVMKIGDEPSMFKIKHPEMPVAVAENRVMGVAELLGEAENVNLVLLDDVFQHRAILPHIQILLTKYNELFCDDLVLPTGNLREARGGAKRADVIIVTKCPTILSENERAQIVKKIGKYNNEVPVFFSNFVYGKLVNVFDKGAEIGLEKEILAFAGIANTELFFNKLSESFKIQSFSFKDHHPYIEGDLEKLKASYNCSNWICTEKDAIKLVSFKNWFDRNKIQLYFLPITVEFTTNDFNAWLLESVKLIEAQLLEN